MSIRVGDKHVVAPSGVQKERMEASDLFVLDPQGNVLEQPVARPAPYKAPKLSECYPLFQQAGISRASSDTVSHHPIVCMERSNACMQAFDLREAGAVMHSHSVNAVLATLLDGGSEFRVTNLEMIKVHDSPHALGLGPRQPDHAGIWGPALAVSSVPWQGIQGHGYYDTCCIPIIENTARECELTASLREAILKYPGTQAVLVRRHGVYVWGKDWVQAKTQVRPWLALQVVPTRFAP